jgi:hypothetical protein
MKGKTTANSAVPLPRRAIPEEILRAVEALTDEDSERIDQIAINRMMRIGPLAAAGRSYEDLIHISLLRLLEGDRNWNPDDISFVNCFIGVIRSIASEWAGHRHRNEYSPGYAIPESVYTTTGEDGTAISPFDRVRSESLTPEEEAIELEREADRKALIDQIFASFADDEDATFVLWGIEEGKAGPEICVECGFTEKQFRTITKRIKRRAIKIMEKRDAK